jgi:hypothetical protein
MNTTVTDASRSEAQQQMDWLKGLAAPLLIPILAMAGQWLITQPEASLIAGAACFASSLALFLWILAGWPRAALPAPPAQSVSRRCHPVINNREVRVSLAVGAAILAGAAFLGFEGNHLMGGLWLWLGAILLFLLAFVEVPDFKPGGWKQAAAGWWHDLDKRVLVILLAIMLLAIFFRVYRLNTVPAETTSDHAEKLLDVRDVLDGARPIFFHIPGKQRLFRPCCRIAGCILLGNLPLARGDHTRWLALSVYGRFCNAGPLFPIPCIPNKSPQRLAVISTFRGHRLTHVYRHAHRSLSLRRTRRTRAKHGWMASIAQTIGIRNKLLERSVLPECYLRGTLFNFARFTPTAHYYRRSQSFLAADAQPHSI